MIEVADFPKTGSFKIGAFKIYLNEFTYDELCDVLGVPEEIFLVLGHEDVYMYKYEESGLGRILAFREREKVVEIHFEPEQDVLIKKMVSDMGKKPKMILNKRLKYLFFCEQIAGRILDEKRGTLNVLGFFDREYLKRKQLPYFFLSGIAYDPTILRSIYID